MKKFKDVYKSFTAWAVGVVDPIKKEYPNAEWIDDSKMFSTSEQIFNSILDKYSERYLRYPKGEFEGYARNIMREWLPNLFLKQRVLVNDEFDKLKEQKERGKGFRVESANSVIPYNSKGSEFNELEDNANQKAVSNQNDASLLRSAKLTQSIKLNSWILEFAKLFDDLFMQYSNNGDDLKIEIPPSLFEVVRSYFSGFIDVNETAESIFVKGEKEIEALKKEHWKELKLPNNRPFQMDTNNLYWTDLNFKPTKKTILKIQYRYKTTEEIKEVIIDFKNKDIIWNNVNFQNIRVNNPNIVKQEITYSLPVNFNVGLIILLKGVITDFMNDDTIRNIDSPTDALFVEKIFYK